MGTTDIITVTLFFLLYNHIYHIYKYLNTISDASSDSIHRSYRWRSLSWLHDSMPLVVGSLIWLKIVKLQVGEVWSHAVTLSNESKWSILAQEPQASGCGRHDLAQDRQVTRWGGPIWPKNDILHAWGDLTWLKNVKLLVGCCLARVPKNPLDSSGHRRGKNGKQHVATCMMGLKNF